MKYTQLLEQNIWWKGEIDKDIHLRKFKEKKISWDPKLKDKISLKPSSLNIVLGPRQVGKTTALKLMVKELLQKYDPKQIFYFNCDELTDSKDLIKLINSYLKFKKNEGFKTSIIILDEIMSPENWTKAIKSLIDKGSLEKECLIVTGSNSIRVKREAEYFPGRRGSGRDVLLLPLNFRRFTKVLNPELISKIPFVEDFSQKNLTKSVSTAMNYCDELNDYLDLYLKFGGFPLALNALKTKQNLYEAKKSYQDGFISDILKVGANIKTAKEVISTIIEKIPSHFSYNNVGNDIGKSSKTVESYLKLFQDLYSLVVLNNVDISSKAFKLGKNKKIHFIDPLMLAVFNDWSLSEKKIDKPLLVESVVAANIAMLNFDHFSIGERICYWSNGNEIDVIVKMKRAFGFEVKWSSKMDVSKYSKYASHFKGLYFLGKEDYQPEKNIFPVACFLAVISEETVLLN